MNDFEDELRDRLATRAGSVAVGDDWGDLIERMTKSARRTTRGLSLSLVLLLCASTVAVVVAARNAGGSDARPTASRAVPVGGRADGVVATHAAVPTIAAPGGASTPAFAGGSKAITIEPSGPAGYGKASVVTGPTIGISYGAAMKMARVFTRTTAGGETIRAYRADVSPDAASGPPWWTPPGWCYPNGYVQADVSDDAVAGVATSPLYAARKDGSSLGGMLSVIGQNEQAVRWIVVAQGPAAAATLRVTFPDGTSDAMTPVGGVAVFVGHGDANTDLTKAKLRLVALSGSGATLATTSIDGNSAYPAFGPECSDPQTLPAAGAHQPTDPAAARQAVIDVFDKAYAKGVNDDATLFGYFDDSHGFADVLAKLRVGTFKDQVKGAVMKFNDLVFLSPTVAAIQYEIDIPGYSIPSFSPRFNEAHLVGGQWKLARQGFCDDVGLAGVQCPA